MNKIICDVCGTAYQESATQCPICGCVRTAQVEDTISDHTLEANARTYTHVKGGRFSKANVKKRNRASQAKESVSTAEHTASRRTKQPKKKSNTGLIVTAIILLLAIVAVVIYLAIKLFLPALPAVDDPVVPPVIDEIETTEPTISCEELTLDVDEVFFDEIGSARMLYANVSPIDTTDGIQYVSSDTSVVTVTETGKVESVGPGEATITVTCGSQTATCFVICEAIEPTEETTAPVLSKVTVSAEEIRLNRKDITFSYSGESWFIYGGSLNAEDLQWISNNDTIASIENGTVKAVSSGTTTVHAVYTEEDITGTKSIVVNIYEDADEEHWSVICTDEEGNEVTAPIADGIATFSNLDPSKSYDVSVKVSCIIRCSFESSDYQGVGGHGGAGADGEG